MAVLWPRAREDAADVERRARRDRALARLDVLMAELQASVGRLQAQTADQAERMEANGG